MGRYLDNLPPGIESLSRVVIEELRKNGGGSYTSLTSKQQRIYDELGGMVLSHVIQSPQAASLLGKLGPNEEAYGLNLTEIDEAVLRVHYYSNEGVDTVDPSSMSSQPVDIVRFGTPHNHRGNISAIVPVGRLIHHTFQETDGNDYTSGKIGFEEVSDSTRAYKFRSSIFVPTGSSGLNFEGSEEFNTREGYWMDKQQIHVVSWPEPTITVFFNDFSCPHESTVYQAGDVTQEIERPRALAPAQRTIVWKSFVDLARNHLS
jgi:hypothetical protein